MFLRSAFSALLLVAAATLTAQNWDPSVYRMGDLYPGYVIDASGTRTDGYIKLQDRYSMQNDVQFFANQEDKKSKMKYKTSDLKEYKVADKVYHCINYSGGLSGSAIRANLVVAEGCITQYVWYNKAENFALIQKGANETEEAYMERLYPSVMVFMKPGDEKPRSLDYFGLKFATKMSEYVAENKELAAKVLAKEDGYGMLRIMEIIQEYNAACTPK
jgi:hypothetical protein